MNKVLHRWGVLLFIAVLLAGCRTYGAYDNEEATLRRIEQMHAQGGEALARRQADLRALQQMNLSPLLMEGVATLDETVVSHRALLEQHDALVASAMADPNNYRELHHAYGTLVAEHRRMEDRYERIYSYLAQAGEAMQADSARADSLRNVRAVAPEAWHQVAPPFFERIRYQNERVTQMEQVNAVRQTPAVQAVPDTTGVSDAPVTSPVEAEGEEVLE